MKTEFKSKCPDCEIWTLSIAMEVDEPDGYFDDGSLQATYYCLDCGNFKAWSTIITKEEMK